MKLLHMLQGKLNASSQPKSQQGGGGGGGGGAVASACWERAMHSNGQSRHVAKDPTDT